jgi:hypothetical protein
MEKNARFGSLFMSLIYIENKKIINENESLNRVYAALDRKKLTDFFVFPKKFLSLTKIFLYFCTCTYMYMLIFIKAYRLQICISTVLS